jgi:hypothetical protein
MTPSFCNSIASRYNYYLHFIMCWRQLSPILNSIHLLSHPNRDSNKSLITLTLEILMRYEMFISTFNRAWHGCKSLRDFSLSNSRFALSGSRRIVTLMWGARISGQVRPPTTDTWRLESISYYCVPFNWFLTADSFLLREHGGFLHSALRETMYIHDEITWHIFQSQP